MITNLISLHNERIISFGTQREVPRSLLDQNTANLMRAKCLCVLNQFSTLGAVSISQQPLLESIAQRNVYSMKFPVGKYWNPQRNMLHFRMFP